MRIVTYISIIILSGILSGCDKVEFPNEGETLTPPLNSRRVLLKDFTGHTCLNCPGAAVIANELAADFPDHVTVISIHPDLQGLSTPVPNTDGSYNTDWRTPEGSNFQSIYGVTQIPVGVVSGVSNEFGILWPSLSWRSLIEEVIFEDRQVSIDSLQILYDSDTRNMSVSGSLEFKTTLSGQYNLVLATVENNIIDWQLNGSDNSPSDPAFPGGDVENYVHKHVLRNHLNGVFGEEISGEYEQGVEYVFNNESTLSQDFVAEEVSIYAYVFNSETLEILDILERHIIE